MRLAIAFVFGVAFSLACCVSMRDRAALSLHESKATGDAFAERLHSRCTLGYQAAISPQDVARLDAACLPARRALDDYRDAWVDLRLSVEREEADDVLRVKIVRLNTCASVLGSLAL